MKKRILAAMLTAALLLFVLAGCGNKPQVVSQEKAQQIAIEEVGITEDQVSDAHIHVTTVDGIPCYSVHLSTEEEEYSVVIHAGTGEVLDSTTGANH